MKKKDMKLGAEARTAILTVAKHMGDMLGATLGPAGRNYMLPTGITNDGKTIAQHIRYEDENLDDIALSFYEIADRTDKEAGDNTTTSTVFGTALASEVLGKVADINTPAPGQENVMELARRMETEKDEVIEALIARAVPVEELETLKLVARTSMENDEVADLIAETVFEAGKDSYTAIEDGYSGKVEKAVFKGIRLPAKTAAPFMFNNDRKEAAHSGLPVLVVDHAFEEYGELSPFMQSLISELKEAGAPFKGLIIVARNYSVPFIATVANTSRQIKVPMVLLQLNESVDVYEDLAAYLGADLLDTQPRNGRSLSEATMANTGMALKVVANAKETVFIGGRGLSAYATHAEHIMTGGEPTTRVQARIMALESELAAASDANQRDAIKKRITKLSGGIATIYVDAATAQERYYLRMKVEDALNSCKGALTYGVIPGGGQTLRDIAKDLEAKHPEGSLLAKALRAPYMRIQQNAGGSLEIPDTVIDSVHGAICGTRNAVSVVKVLLTTEGIISDHVRDFAQELGESLYKGAE